jgi:hypothetical protein
LTPQIAEDPSRLGAGARASAETASKKHFRANDLDQNELPEHLVNGKLPSDSRFPDHVHEVV